MIERMECIRCGSKDRLERDHIIPRSRGGTDDHSNKRWLCTGCHDYRHAKDNILQAINRQLKLFNMKSGRYNSAKFSMYIMRLGIIEAFNTPKMIRERKLYLSYWNASETHYDRWYPKIKLANMKKKNTRRKKRRRRRRKP